MLQNQVPHDLFFKTVELVGYDRIECHLYTVIEYVYATDIIVDFPAVFPIGNSTVAHYSFGKFT